MKKVIIVNTLLSLSNLLLLPFWIYEDNFKKFGPTIVPTLSLLLSACILPSVLGIYTGIAIPQKIKNLVWGIPILLCSSVILNLCAYFNWGISTGRLTNPDGATVGITQFATFFAVFLTVVLFFAALFICWLIGEIKNKKYNKTVEEELLPRSASQ